MHGLNHKSRRWRDCGLGVILRSLPDIKFSGHPSLRLSVTFTATDGFALFFILLWHTAQRVPPAQREAVLKQPDGIYAL